MLPTIPAVAAPPPPPGIPPAPPAPSAASFPGTGSSASVALPREPTITKSFQTRSIDTGSWRAPPQTGAAIQSPSSRPGPVRPGSIPPGPLPPASAEEKVGRLITQLSAAREMLDRHESDLKALRSRLELADARLGELEEEHRDRAALGALIEAVASRVKELELVAERVRVGDSTLRQILEQNERQADERRTRIATLEGVVAEMGGRLKSMEVLLTAAPAGGAGAPSRGGRDDLRRIRGIGPKFERALNDLGVLTYAQIAAWTEEDVARISGELGTRVDRVHREGWIAAAKKLCGE